MPDDVTDGLDRVQEPHERRIRSPANIIVIPLSFNHRSNNIFCGPLAFHKTLKICSYVGFSRALGSSLPNPAGDFSASSVDMRISSASTLPCYILSVTELSGVSLTWRMSSSFSSLAYIGHQPLVLFCLNRFMVGTEPSVFSMPRLHCFAVFAPRGNLFRSRVMDPRKSS